MPPIAPAPRDPQWIRERLTVLLDRLQAHARAPEPPTRRAFDEPISAAERALAEQLPRLAAWARLDRVECDVLALCATAGWIPPFDGLLPELTAPTRAALFNAFAAALDAPVREIRRALRDDGALAAVAELSVEGTRPVHLDLDPEDSPVSDLGAPDLTVDEIVAGMLESARPASLPLEAHAHLGAAVATALQVLRGAVAVGAPGVHVLVHGPPGVGKTELALALAAAVSPRPVEVPISWSSGEPVWSEFRLGAWGRLQRLLAPVADAVVVFDEAEDAMGGLDRPNEERRNRVSKGALTRQLERAPRPTVWVTNDASSLDPAYLRRFTLVIEARTPPVGARRALADRWLGAVDAGTRQALAEHPEVTPALLEQASRSLALIDGHSGLSVDEAARALVSGHLSAPLGTPGGSGSYDVDLLELGDGTDARALAQRAAAGEGRLLLHGPPGTGKSAFAAYLAEVAGRPLRRISPSDLLSCWVGETEARIRAAFRDAAAEGAVLVLDEAEALLFPRASARASWEGSQVAQTLLELERFPGLLVATTNLLPRVDEAFHRRFDLIVEARVPGLARRGRLVATLAAELGVDPPDAAGLAGLVPGHLAQLRRRFKLTGPPEDSASLADALRSAIGARRSVGFRG